MSIFDLSIKPTPSPCASTDYLFYIATPAQAAKEGESVSLTVVGGIGPYDWVSLSPGVSITDAQTTVLTNTLTIDALPWGGYAYYKVTDSCGTERVGAIGLWDDYSFDCHSVACEAASELLFSGPTVDVDTGSQYTASGGVAPYRYRVTHGAIDGTGQVVGFYDLASSTYQITVTVIDMCGNKKSIEATRLLPPIALSDNWILAPGESVPFLNYGCDDDMRYSINCGEIDKRTGEILSLDGCECTETITVTGEDGCRQSDDSSQVNPNQLTLSGTETPSVGSVYTASGGAQPYNYSFDGGTIDSAGIVTAVATSCDAYGASGAVGVVSVLDACGQTKTIEVRLPVSGALWLTTSDTTFVCDNCCSCSGSPGYNGRYNTGSKTVTVGGTRIYEGWAYHCDDCTNNCEHSIIGAASDIPICRRIYYTWSCP